MEDKKVYEVYFRGLKLSEERVKKLQEENSRPWPAGVIKEINKELEFQNEIKSKFMNNEEVQD